MGFRRYRGPIDTVEHALMAHMTVTITCQECFRPRRKWAYRIYEQAGPAVIGMALRKPIKGFYCTGCRKSVLVVIGTDYERV